MHSSMCGSARSGRWLAAAVVVLAATVSCGGGSVSADCDSDHPCPPGRACVDGTCRLSDAGTDDAAGDAGADADADTDADDGTSPDGDGDGAAADGACAPGETPCAETCCAGGDRCVFDTCIPDLGGCETSDDCWSDSYCEGGVCVPYGVPPGHTSDETCERSIDIEAIVPAVQCRWTGPPEGDAAPSHFHVMSTPVVADLDLDSDPGTLAPSIVFTTFPTAGSYGGPGVLRIVDGATCAQQWSFPDAADAAMSPASPALGDVDGDGRAEVVVAAHGGGLLAFRYDPVSSTFARSWRSAVCDGAGGRTPDSTGGADQWSGPSIHDLDDDGVPEILYGATVYAADGCVRSSAFGYPSYHKGVVPVVADVDEDGVPELVFGNAIYAWDAVAGDLVPEPYFAGTGLGHGQVAVADLGVFPLVSMGDGDRAEVVVVASGSARVQTIEGTVVFPATTIPGGGTGGLPTIADFDGDGRAEFASAGGTRYVVFDLDCVPGGDPAGCGSGTTDGILWTQPSQDASSNVTGSSVFDFDANGSAEAVYADECYLRIYDGSTGVVRFSVARSSGTTYENPVIVDVDGDFHSEIVSSVNDYAGTLGCPSTDPLYPSASFSTGHGIVVLRDELDRWAASRPIWNQHAYAVTNVGDRGEIPRASAVAVNWRDPTLNNFRQNVQGGLDALGVPDLTAWGDPGPVSIPCDDGAGTLEARVCNRGLLPVGAGMQVSFREGSPTGPELCRAAVAGVLGVGECAVVSCDATLPATETDVYVVVDPDGGEDECLERNNVGVIRGVVCQTIG